MIKFLFGGTFFVAAMLWFFWSISPQEPCERIRRAAVPVGMAGSLVRAGLENWISDTDRLRILAWSMEGEEATRSFLAHQFFGDKLNCGK